MKNITRPTLDATPLDGHRALSQQLEALEAKADALHRADGNRRPLLADLRRAAQRFVALLANQIATEEAGFDSRATGQLSEAVNPKFRELHLQHRDLAKASATLLKLLADAQSADGPIATELLETIYTKIRLIRYAFSIHSFQEEQVLGYLESPPHHPANSGDEREE